MSVNFNNISSTISSNSLLSYIHRLSGQSKKVNIIEREHSYSKCWNKHPDPNIKSRPAKFLFMNSFPKHFLRHQVDEEEIDVESVPKDEESILPNLFVLETNNSVKTGPPQLDESLIVETIPNKTGWSPALQRLWAKALVILYLDRLNKLMIDGTPNEMIHRKIASNRCANKFRYVLSSVASWDANLLPCLHSALNEYLSPPYLVAYHETMQILRQKIPTLVDKFYIPLKTDIVLGTRNKTPLPDPIQTVLANHKPKRIAGSPLFLIVPNGPQMPHSLISQRMKHWHNIFGSLGKVITPTISFRPDMKVSESLQEIRLAIREKINECRSTFNEIRPLILVGFGHSSLIAAHCALDNAAHVTATVCLGFPLTGINGFRGDLDDPLLETTVPSLFVIGQNSTMSTIDDMEDFRERITKTDTGLVVVGGANDRLIVSDTKQRFCGVTQSIVDRCIADEIYDFVSCVLNPHYISDCSSFKSPSSSKNSAKGPSRTSSAKDKPKPPKKKKPKKEIPIEKDKAKNGDKIVKNPIMPSPLPEAIEPPKKKKLPEEIPPENEPSKELPTENIVQPLETNAPEISPVSAHTQQNLEPSNLSNFERHYGFSYEVSEVPTLVNTGNTRTRQIRAPKQLDM